MSLCGLYLKEVTNNTPQIKRNGVKYIHVQSIARRYVLVDGENLTYYVPIANTSDRCRLDTIWRGSVGSMSNRERYDGLCYLILVCIVCVRVLSIFHEMWYLEFFFLSKNVKSTACCDCEIRYFCRGKSICPQFLQCLFINMGFVNDINICFNTKIARYDIWNIFFFKAYPIVHCTRSKFIK